VGYWKHWYVPHSHLLKVSDTDISIGGDSWNAGGNTNGADIGDSWGAEGGDAGGGGGGDGDQTCRV
jgi:hypothetical protein